MSCRSYLDSGGWEMLFCPYSMIMQTAEHMNNFIMHIADHDIEL